ncbi:MAG TPA: hypothetical protein PKI66_00205 [Methanobacteriaceae archaeon]|jgi:hypothetical protein|nr:hypothetical protein [Methanobacteriaceae archaeon]
MENISKNTDIPRKRGRPKKEHLNNPLLTGVINQMNPDVRTRRGKNNLVYGVFFGVSEIYDKKKKELKDPLFKFLFNPEENKFKKTILSALGRVALEYGPEEAEILTREICKRKMSTGEALAFISAVRGLGKDKITGVVKKIIRLFNDNRITPDEAREVVARIGEIIRVSETE